MVLPPNSEAKNNGHVVGDQKHRATSPSSPLSPSSPSSPSSTRADPPPPHISPSSPPQSSLPHPHKATMPSKHEPSEVEENPPPPQSPQGVVLSPISLVSTCEEMNPSRRSSFEDCSIYAPAGTWKVPDENMAFLAVVDGHGGRDIVEFLEDYLPYHISQELQFEELDENDSSNTTTNKKANQTLISNDSIHKRLERAFYMADIHSKAMGLINSGATVAMCLVTRGKSVYDVCDDTATTSQQKNNDDAENQDNTWTIYAANAGDARIVLGHGGEAHRLTKDHKADDPEEIRRIEGSGGFVFKGRVLGILAVTRSLGDHCMKEYVIATPYTSEKTITIASEAETSFIIAACDGLWDVFEDQEAVDFVLERIEEKELAAKYLVEEALKRGSTDNITVSVAFLT